MGEACINSAAGAYGEILGESACTSGLDAIGPVYAAPESDVVVMTVHSCPDCMAEQSYSDWYKEEYGSRPRHLSKAEMVDAWWAMPEIAGVRP